MFFVFCFFLTVVLNKDENDPNNTSCPTDYTLAPPPCRKPCAMNIYLEQIFEYI